MKKTAVTAKPMGNRQISKQEAALEVPRRKCLVIWDTLAILVRQGDIALYMETASSTFIAVLGIGRFGYYIIFGTIGQLVDD
jgi:hypothetical protein